MSHSSVALQWSAAFAADFHLQASDPELVDSARRFIELCAVRTRRLFLLGDVFDLWTSPALLELQELQSFYQALRKASSAGLSIVFLPGNRDFNLDDRTGRILGIDVGPEEYRTECGGHRLLLTHGDCFLQNDVAYQRMKKLIRSWPVRFLARHLPGSVSLHMARHLRRYSSSVVPQKDVHRLAIVHSAVASRFEGGCDTVVCGHVHRAERRRFGAGRDLLVLPAFQHERRFVLLQNGRFQLCDLDEQLSEIPESSPILSSDDHH